MTAKPEPLLLIIEDDEAFARTLSRSFERRGYRVLVASGYEEAQALLQQHTPGYAVVDLKLKGNTSGLSCVQLLHEHERSTASPPRTSVACRACRCSGTSWTWSGSACLPLST